MKNMTALVVQSDKDGRDTAWPLCLHSAFLDALDD